MTSAVNILPIVLQDKPFLTTNENNSKNKGASKLSLSNLHMSSSSNLFSSIGSDARKRRVRPAPVQRIELGAAAATSYTGNLNEFYLDGDEASSTELSDYIDESPDTDGNEELKRLRLCSQSSSTHKTTFPSSPIYELLNSVNDVPSPQVDSLVQLPHGVIQPIPNLAELEGAETVTGSIKLPHTKQLSNGGLILVDQERGHQFELVGDGRNCKAVDTSSQTFYHCQTLKLDEYKVVTEIMARMQNASKFYSEKEFEERSNLLLPLDQLRVLRNAQRQGIVFLLLPDHYGTLHQLMEENEMNFSDAASTSCSEDSGPAHLSECRAQPILRQIVVLMEFCHRIGLFFKDFRLRKFVFIDEERQRIRVNNVLDLHLTLEPAGGDMIVSREFIPAYVAPEVLDKKNKMYAGGAADVWAFGVLMFTLLNGRYPFFESSPSPIALLRRIRAHHFTFPINESISGSARWLIHALLCPRPEDRPNAVQLLQSAHWLFAEAKQLLDDPELIKQRKKKAQTECWELMNKSMAPMGAFTASLVPEATSALNNNIDGIMTLQQRNSSNPFVVVQVPSRSRISSTSTEWRKHHYQYQQCHIENTNRHNQRHRSTSQTNNNPSMGMAPAFVSFDLWKCLRPKNLTVRSDLNPNFLQHPTASSAASCSRMMVCDQP